MKSARSAPLAALAAMTAIWGYSWILMAIGLRHAHPFDFAAVRVAMGSALLFGVVKAMGRPLALPAYRMAAVLGLLQVSLFVAFSHYALLYAGAGRTSVLVYTMPFWMIVLAQFLLRERMRGAQWASVALAFAGLTLIVAPWKLTSLAGSILAISAGAVWALAAVLSKRFPTRGAEPLIFTAWQLLFGSIPLAVLALAHPHDPIRWNREFVIALVFSAVFATAMAWWLWTYVLSHTSAGIAGLNALGVPVVAVASSAIQLGERPPPHELAGMAAIAAALALLAFLGLRRPQPAAVPGNPVD